MKPKNESERLARMVRLDQVDSLQLLAAKTGVPAEKLAERWQSSSRADANRASGKKQKKLVPPSGTVPYAPGS
ncbi:MAG TPA: hypothetical protein VFL79_14530 [Terriglobia bacterium]|nr:hypothetical protein [Terriglobia bacterium]